MVLPEGSLSAEDIRSSFNKFQEELAEDVYAVYTEGKRSHEAEIIRKYDSLFTPERIKAIETEAKKKAMCLDDPKTDAELALTRLREYLRTYVVEKKVANSGIEDKIEDYIETKILSVSAADGTEKTVSFKKLAKKTFHPGSDWTKQELDTLQHEYVHVLNTELNPLLLKEVKESKSAYCELGLNDKKYEASRSKDKKLSERLLTETEGIYNGISNERVDYSKFSEYFTKEKLMPALKKTLNGLGIDLDSQSSITMDLKYDENKYNRPFCMPVSVPRDVRIVMSVNDSAWAQNGYYYYQALFHEMGHAQHFANSKQKYFELNNECVDKRADVMEFFAFAMESITKDDAWLSKELGMPKDAIAEYKKEVLRQDAWLIRREAINFLNGQEIYDAAGEGGTLAKLKRDCKLRLKGIDEYASGKGASEFMWTNRDQNWDHYINYVRANVVLPKVLDSFRERFGTEWYSNKKAGDCLKKLWSYGDRFELDDIAKRAGVGGNIMSESRLVNGLKSDYKQYVLKQKSK